MNEKPANYWRQNKNWSQLIGRVGKVIFSTKIEVSSPELEDYLPYSFAIVEVDGKKYEFMSEKGADLKKGDKVELVLRKTGKGSNSSLINYGIKLVNVS